MRYATGPQIGDRDGMGWATHWIPIRCEYECLRKEFPETTLIWVNYNDLTTTSLEIMVSKGNDPQLASIQVSELL